MATSFFGGSFFDGEFFGDGSTPPPTPVATTVQSGVRNRKRRWALRYHGKLYYFEDLRALEAFANQPIEEATRVPQKKARPKIVVPIETIREAREAGFDGLQKLADRLDYQALRKIEELAFRERIEREEEEDFRDFMAFLRQLDG